MGKQLLIPLLPLRRVGPSRAAQAALSAPACSPAQPPRSPQLAGCIWGSRGCSCARCHAGNTQPWGRDSAQLSLVSPAIPTVGRHLSPLTCHAVPTEHHPAQVMGGHSIYLPPIPMNVTPEAPPSLPCPWGPSSWLPPSACSTFLEQSQVLPPCQDPPAHRAAEHPFVTILYPHTPLSNKPWGQDSQGRT